MEGQIFQFIGLYFVYYIVIPALIVFTIWKIKQKKDFIKTFSLYNEDEEEKYNSTLEESNKKLKNLQILFVVLILISIPVLNITFQGLQDISMHTTRYYLSDETVYPAHIDRVEGKFGTSFDTTRVIEQMEESEYEDWYLDDIRDQIDLEEIFRFPGRITVYKLRSTTSHPEQIVITYSYFSPIPITRSIEFIIIRDKAFLETNRIIAYPMPPSLASPS